MNQAPRTPPLPVRIPIQLRFARDRRARGLARRLGRDGVFVETDARPGLDCRLDLQFPGLTPTDFNPILFPAQVVQQTDTGLGLEFRALEGSAAAALERLLAPGTPRRGPWRTLIERLAG
jgi:hypothetical protein